MSNKSKKAQKVSSSDLERTRRHAVADMSRQLEDSIELSSPTHRYLRHMADPRGCPAERRPSTGAVYPGRTGLDTCKVQFEITVGSGGYGAVSLNLENGAACADRAIGFASVSPSWAGSSSTGLPATTDAALVTPVYLKSAPYMAASFGTDNRGQNLTAAVNAGAAYITPIGSATDQNGMIYLLEAPNHNIGSSVSGHRLTLADVASHPSTRSLRAVQFGSPDVDNCINWHPQYGDLNNGVDSEGWIMPQGASSGPQDNASLAIVVTGTTGTRYNVEIVVSYLTKGLLVQGLKPRICDPLGMACIFNLLVHKTVSGWIGRSSQAVSAYEHAAVSSSKASSPVGKLRKESAVAALSKGPSTMDAIKSFAPLAREVAGFVLPKVLSFL